MAKAKLPGSTGAEQGAQDEQNNPAPGDGAADSPAAEPAPPAATAVADPTAPPAEGPAPVALVKARVLVAGAYGQCNDVVEVDVDTAKALPDVLDSTPEAVAYAESLAGEQ
ncbi:hypothetical protein [Telluria beijingensis]|uniref:hypothetical protein n=1 Tax=Telluria beijingensis TaxID=3068633 RepID=UPI0027962369|nr:hypothetical protein [Massilia sp. REN29]